MVRIGSWRPRLSNSKYRTLDWLAVSSDARGLGPCQLSTVNFDTTRCKLHAPPSGKSILFENDQSLAGSVLGVWLVRWPLFNRLAAMRCLPRLAAKGGTSIASQKMVARRSWLIPFCGSAVACGWNKLNRTGTTGAPELCKPVARALKIIAWRCQIRLSWICSAALLSRASATH